MRAQLAVGVFALSLAGRSTAAGPAVAKLPPRLAVGALLVGIRRRRV